ncbi:hypothetical protein HHI36_015289 [Cryptolaemus montrouzieri]|uniref:Uncharacterized protein n=1 Tax=Cryptolaemus montrouzieri TaxID=559131 RepID=A0ABD2N5G9_9CUCU
MSTDEDIEFVSVEEFMKEASQSVTAKFKDMNEDGETKTHELRLARLEYELEQKNLAKLCKTLEEDEKKIALGKKSMVCLW